MRQLGDVLDRRSGGARVCGVHVYVIAAVWPRAVAAPTRDVERSPWRDDFFGHCFPDGRELGPHVNIWIEGIDESLPHLFYPGGG